MIKCIWKSLKLHSTLRYYMRVNIPWGNLYSNSETSMVMVARPSARSLAMYPLTKAMGDRWNLRYLMMAEELMDASQMIRDIDGRSLVIEVEMKSRPWFNMCWGLNSHFFPMVGMVIKLMVYSLKGFPVKLGWPSPIYGVDRPVGTYRDCTEIVLDSTAWESRQQNQGFHIDGIFSSLFSRHFFNDGCHLFLILGPLAVYQRPKVPPVGKHWFFTRVWLHPEIQNTWMSQEVGKWLVGGFYNPNIPHL